MENPANGITSLADSGAVVGHFWQHSLNNAEMQKNCEASNFNVLYLS
jgi:hypothetical protein